MAKTEIIEKLSKGKYFKISNKPTHKFNDYTSDRTGLSSFLIDDLNGGFIEYQEVKQ